MKIFQKLSLIVLSSAFLFMGIGFVSLRRNSKVKANVDQAVLEADKTRNLLEDIQIKSRILEIELHDYIHSLEEPEITPTTLEEKQQEILTILSQLKNNLSNLEKMSDKFLKFDIKSSSIPENKPRIDPLDNELHIIKIAAQLRENYQLIENIIESTIKAKDFEDPHEFFSKEIEPVFEKKFYALLSNYRAGFSLEQRDRTKLITDNLNNNDLVIVGYTGVALIFSLIVGIYTAQTISRPIEQLKNAAILIGKGKLDVQVPDHQNNEIGILGQTFNQMILGLKNTTVSKFYLDKILSSMVDSLIVIAPEGTMTKVNPATSYLLGYQESELIGENLKLILGDSSLNIKNLSQTSWQQNLEVTYLTKDGKEIPISFSSSVIQNEYNEIKGIVCLGRDISEKQQTEKALRESEQRYALASRATNDGLWDWNIVSNEIYFSSRWKSMLGYEEEAFGKTTDEWFKKVHPDYLEQFSQAITSYLKNPLSHLEISYPMLHKDGSYRWMLCRAIGVINEQGEISRLTGSQTDITSSRLAEEKLRHQALYDELTGLPNRSFFLEKLNKLFALKRNSPEQMFAVLFLDLSSQPKIKNTV